MQHCYATSFKHKLQKKTMQQYCVTSLFKHNLNKKENESAMELQTTLSATLKKNPNCCYIANFKCNLPKEPYKQNKIIVMLQASSVTYQRKHKLLYTKPKKNTIETHPTKENAKFFFKNKRKKTTKNL